MSATAKDIRDARKAMTLLRRHWRNTGEDKSREIAILQGFLAENKDYVTRRCRRTGTKVSVATSDAAGFDEKAEGLLYYAICETHSTLVGTATRNEAETAASHPDWCEKCQQILNGEREKHPTGDPTGDDQKAIGEE